MFFKAICVTLICSTVLVISMLKVHRWFRLRRPESGALENEHTVSPAPTPPTHPTEEVRAKPVISTGPNTQHLQHEGTDVYVISSVTECEDILSNIPRENLSLLGFDCEWAQSYHLDEIVNTTKGDSLSAFVYPVALIQIATMDSRCYLIRLSQMRNQIPQSLVNILQDERCLKFGVSCLNDLNRIKNHYLIQPKGGVDLRHLAHNRMLGERIGLQALSKHFLGIDLCKDPILQRSNWQSPCLTLDQIKYASIDAKVALSILFSLLELICRERSIPQAVDYCGPNSSPDFIDLVFEISSPYIGVPFAGQSSRTHHRQSNKSDVFTADSLKKHTPYVTRKRALYENCRLLAPDNELLSLIDTRKVNWYFERDLAELVSEDPYVVKLKFEPKIRPEKGNVDKLYYQAEKQNICVVCGSKDGNGIRKKIVPAEYRKHFPLDHKSYKSHDNLLLCGTCHLVTSLNEDVLKLRIAKEYDSPIDSGASKLNSDPLLFKVKNAARALAQTKYTLPNHKQTEYREIVREFYQVDELGDELIQKASKIDPKNENPNYRAHGEKVVEQVIANGELLQFQMRWRQHFLETMKPKFLPEMWSTTHNPNKDNYF